MKRLLVIMLLIGGAFVIGYKVMTGRLPWVALSDEEQEVLAFRQEFNRIRQLWQTAGRTQALGVDASSQVDDPLARLERLEQALADFTPRLKTTEAKLQADSLRGEMATFKAEMR